eukprot:m.166388 g.166388  ORF g.166388 m.166388 type:complete len:521 (-) comp15241_c0_seq1:1214-2776(-)
MLDAARDGCTRVAAACCLLDLEDRQALVDQPRRDGGGGRLVLARMHQHNAEARPRVDGKVGVKVQGGPAQAHVELVPLVQIDILVGLGHRLEHVAPRHAVHHQLVARQCPGANLGRQVGAVLLQLLLPGAVVVVAAVVNLRAHDHHDLAHGLGQPHIAQDRVHRVAEEHDDDVHGAQHGQRPVQAEIVELLVVAGNVKDVDGGPRLPRVGCRRAGRGGIGGAGLGRDNDFVDDSGVAREEAQARNEAHIHGRAADARLCNLLAHHGVDERALAAGHAANHRHVDAVVEADGRPRIVVGKAHADLVAEIVKELVLRLDDALWILLALLNLLDLFVVLLAHLLCCHPLLLQVGHLLHGPLEALGHHLVLLCDLLQQLERGGIGLLHDALDGVAAPHGVCGFVACVLLLLCVGCAACSLLPLPRVGVLVAVEPGGKMKGLVLVLVGGCCVSGSQNETKRTQRDTTERKKEREGKSASAALALARPASGHSHVIKIMWKNDKTLVVVPRASTPSFTLSFSFNPR